MAGRSPATYSVVANTVDEVSTTVAHRLVYLTSAAALGVIVAGFWNFRVVDGFGADVVAANTIGTYQGRATDFATLGTGFGFIFAIVAGLAATFATHR